MSTLRCLFALLLVASAAPVLAQRDAATAREMRREGRMLSAREIERRVIPGMRGAQYLGFDFDGDAVYTLKFLRDGNVIWVDVDARTGAVLGRTGR